LRIHSTRAVSDFASSASPLRTRPAPQPGTIDNQSAGPRCSATAESVTPRSLMIATSCSARSSIALDPAFFVAAQNLLRAVLSSDVTKPELRSFLLALQLVEDPQGCVPFSPVDQLGLLQRRRSSVAGFRLRNNDLLVNTATEGYKDQRNNLIENNQGWRPNDADTRRPLRPQCGWVILYRD
jgi:hypothetical protein